MLYLCINQKKIIMKNFTILLLIIMVLNRANGQMCKNYKFFQSGSEIEMSHFDKKNKLTSVSISKVKNITSLPNGYESSMESVMKDEKGKEVFSGDLKIKCENDILALSMKNMIPGDQLAGLKDMEMKINETFIDYPASLNETAMLKDGNFSAEIYSGNMKIMTMKFEILNRKVVGKENVSTKAGNFDCVKITYTSKIKMVFNISYEVTEWFSPSLGVIKTETSNKGKIIGTSILTSLK
jgi:hypothetical protein